MRSISETMTQHCNLRNGFRDRSLLTRLAAVVFLAAGAMTTLAEVRVQDIARLQGQRTNRLMGFGLVVGLKGSGDAGSYPNTARALQAMHQRFLQPVFDPRELKANNTVAIVAVEAQIPQFGVQEGQAVDVVVSVIGAAKSLEGGQLLTTPLQESTLSVTEIFALAGGKIEMPDPKTPTRGLIRGGAVFEREFVYNFIADGAITLVLDESQAGWPMAQMVARAVNHEVSSASAERSSDRRSDGIVVVRDDAAIATGPQTVVVRIPDYELRQPAGFISRVLQTQLFVMPQQPARVTISRSKRTIVMSGTVTVSPTVLHISGIGSVRVGTVEGAAQAPPGADDVAGMDTDRTATVEFQELLDAFSKIKLSQAQMAEAVEQLHRSGALHAQLAYSE